MSKVSLLAAQARQWEHLASRIQAATLLSMVTIERRNWLLDLGSGNGYIGVKLALAGHRTIAVDHDARKVHGLRQYVAAHTTALALIPFVASAEALPFRTASIQSIVCNSVLEHVADEHAAVTEMARVLVDGGMLAMTLPNEPRRFAYWFPFMWSLVLRLPRWTKRLLLRRDIRDVATISGAREALERRFDHKRLYTPESIRQTLQPAFHVTAVRFYMQFIGAVCHDIIYAIRGLSWLVPLYLMRTVSIIDRLLPASFQGKGFALIARRVRRAESDGFVVGVSHDK